MSLIVNGLSKRYGSSWALRDVSFEIEGGSVVGIFGASASGKTSLLRAIAGTVKTDGGTVKVDDFDLSEKKGKEVPVTYVGDAATGVWATILSSFRSSLSTGEGKFDRFESAIQSAKKVVLLDDPFQQMDRDLRTECFARVRKIGKMKGKIVVFASSDFEQVLELCDEAAYLAGGEIMQTGSPQELYDEPATIDLARLTGPHNLITARRLTSTDSPIPEFHTIDGSHRLFAECTEKTRLGPINQNATLAIRPEQVLLTAGALPPEENLLPATVKAVRRMAATSMIHCDAGGLAIAVRVMKAPTLAPGDLCTLGLPPHKIAIMRD